ncbi:hypothetical protein B0T20DRAFT_485119, partial [Sordaria brevicollis]
MTDNQQQQQQQKPIYVATYGTDPKMAKAVSEKLLPDIEVVHASLSLPTALAELPPLFSGDTSTPPSSSIGTNTSLPPSSRHVPTALLLGGSNLTDEEYDRIVAAIKEAVPGAEGSGSPVQFVRIGKRDVLAAGGVAGGAGAILGGPNPETVAKGWDERGGCGGIGGRQQQRFGGEGNDACGGPVRNDLGKNGVKDKNGNGNRKRFWNRSNPADTDSGIALPDSSSSSSSSSSCSSPDNHRQAHATNNDSLGTAITTGHSFSFAGTTGWRYISLSDDDHLHVHDHLHAHQHAPHSHTRMLDADGRDENVGLLHRGIRFRGKRDNGKKKGKKVVMFASGTIPGAEDDDDDDVDGKKKAGVRGSGKNGKCRKGGWLETLMVHGFGSIAHLYVPCVDFTTIDERDVLGTGNKGEEVVVMSRQHGGAQTHIVIIDEDGVEGIALRDL